MALPVEIVLPKAKPYTGLLAFQDVMFVGAVVLLYVIYRQTGTVFGHLERYF